METIKNNKWKFFILVMFGLSLSIGYGLFSFFFPSTQESILIAENTEKEPENKTVNFLILGVDERDEDVGRSDTIIVLSTNLATKRIGLISIPRDSQVDIPNHGLTKINHSYAYGGAFLTKQIVEKTLNIKIDNYVALNFQAFKNAVDKLGGVDINVEKDMYYRDDYDGENGLLIDLKKGQQHLDGEKAMEYVRYRDEEGDIGRVKRQQTFLAAIISRLTSVETIPKLPSLIKDVFGSIKTDLKFDEFISYLSYLRPNQSFQIKSLMVDGKPQEIDGLSYWIIDYPKLKEDLTELNNFIIDKKENEVVIATTVKDEEGIFKENQNLQNSLDWELEKVTQTAKEKEESIREKLLRKEREEREEALAQKQYQQYFAEKPAINPNGVKIINTTYDKDKISFAQKSLNEHGIETGEINLKETGKANEKTIFIVDSKDEKITRALKSLPFKFTIIYRDNIEKNTLIIGEDFYK